MHNSIVVQEYSVTQLKKRQQRNQIIFLFHLLNSNMEELGYKNKKRK